MRATTYVVEVSYEDEDSGTFGPYTKAQAERVAARLMEEAEMANANGTNLHPRNVRGAYAAPLMRYDDADFLTGAERIETRRAVREFLREARERRAASSLEVRTL